jgi:AraC-like DNA-binding protein
LNLNGGPVRCEIGRLPGAGQQKIKDEKAVNDFLERIYDIIGENLDDPEFGVEELARRIGMSRTTLHRKAKRLAGVPTGHLMRNYRLKRAVEFLRQGYNSSETAYKAGFSSPAYFSKCFRDLYRLSPMEFIRRANRE